MNSSSSSTQDSNLKNWLDFLASKNLQHIEQVETIEKRNDGLGRSYLMLIHYRLKEKTK